MSCGHRHRESDSMDAAPIRSTRSARGPILCVCVVVLSVPSLIFAQRRAPSPEPRPELVLEELGGRLNEKTAADVEAWIERLGSPVFREREDAAQRLLELSVPTLPQLRAAYRRTDDLECRLRIEEIVHTMYFDYHVFDQNGFLGVRMRSYISGQGDVVIPDGTIAVFVTEVIPGHAAERAGLIAGDVVTAIDSEPLTGEPAYAVSRFGALIRSHRPGESMKLTVMRGRETVTLTATLGRCPEDFARTSVTGTTELWRQSNERFPNWWAEHFQLTPASSSLPVAP